MIFLLYLIIMEILNSVLGVTPPIVTLTCTADYSSPRNGIVNATWIPSPGHTPQDVLDYLQNCRATITCDNDYVEKRNCDPESLNSGWEWNLTFLSEMYCSVQFNLILTNESHQVPERSTIENCTFQALAVAYDLPETSNPLLGDSYEIQCRACTDEVVNPNNVTVSWTGPNGTITNDSRLTIIPTVSNGTSHTSTLHFLYLSETDEGEYSCGLVIFEIELNRSNSSTKLKITLPPPIVSVTALNDQIVGDQLSLECNVTTVRGVTSSVDITWMKDGAVVRRINNVSGIATNQNDSMLFLDIFNASTKDDGAVYKCHAEVNANAKVNASDEYVINTSSQEESLNSFNAEKCFVCANQMFKNSSSKVSCCIDDTCCATLEREAVSTCEYIKDMKIWFGKSHMQTVNEECTSLNSNDITDAEMLNFILNQCNEQSKDSGSGSSLLASSKLSENAGRNHSMSKYLSGYSEEMSGYHSGNDLSVCSDHTDRQMNACLRLSSNKSHFLPDYYVDEDFTGNITHTLHKEYVIESSNNEVAITMDDYVAQDLSGKDNVFLAPSHQDVVTSHGHLPLQKDDFGYIPESAI